MLPCVVLYNRTSTKYRTGGTLEESYSEALLLRRIIGICAALFSVSLSLMLGFMFSPAAGFGAFALMCLVVGVVTFVSFARAHSGEPSEEVEQ